MQRTRTLLVGFSLIALAGAPAYAEDAKKQANQDQKSQQQKSAQQQKSKQQDTVRIDLSKWDVIALYNVGWSADEMIGTDVRGENGEEIGEVKDILVNRNGQISRVIVEVGGFLEMGDQHIGVPWKDVKIGRDMQSIQVPLKEVESGTYSLFGKAPQGEQVAQRRGEWRVNELIGDYASLQDNPRYGLVTDVIFDEKGKAQSVVVNRATGAWGRAGWYGYPYHPYNPGALTYSLPYRSAEVADIGRFDYVRFAEQSPNAGDKKQQRAQAKRQGGATAGGSAAQDQKAQQEQKKK